MTAARYGIPATGALLLVTNAGCATSELAGYWFADEWLGEPMPVVEDWVDYLYDWYSSRRTTQLRLDLGESGDGLLERLYTRRDNFYDSDYLYRYFVDATRTGGNWQLEIESLELVLTCTASADRLDCTDEDGVNSGFEAEGVAFAE